MSRIREEGHLIGSTLFPEPDRCECGGFLKISHKKRFWVCKNCRKIIPRIKKRKVKEKPLFRWTPNIKDTEHRKSYRYLLVTAYKRLKKTYPNLKINNKMRDSGGIFAYDTNYGILVAKKQVWGYYVSCHQRAVISAFNQNKNLIMYIEDVRKHYKFNPKEVLEKSKPNLKGSVTMLNFDIKLGVRFD